MLFWKGWSAVKRTYLRIFCAGEDTLLVVDTRVVVQSTTQFNDPRDAFDGGVEIFGAHGVLRAPLSPTWIVPCVEYYVLDHRVLRRRMMPKQPQYHLVGTERVPSFWSWVSRAGVLQEY